MSQDNPTTICKDAIIRLHSAGLEVVEKMRSALILPNHQSGYLSVYTKWGLPICQIYLGQQITPQEARGWGEGHDCCRVLYEKMTLLCGSTSSDFNTNKAGAVYCNDMVICYFDRDGRFDKLTNEAISLLIALKAELLTPDQVWHRHANSDAPTYNSWFNTLLYMYGYKTESVTE